MQQEQADSEQRDPLVSCSVPMVVLKSPNHPVEGHADGKMKQQVPPAIGSRIEAGEKVVHRQADVRDRPGL